MLIINKERNTPLHRSTENDYYKVVELLIIKGADVNAKNNEGNTPLHLQNDNFGVFELLIKNDGDVNQANKEGITPLQLVKKT